jgi:hypothetical protein
MTFVDQEADRGLSKGAARGLMMRGIIAIAFGIVLLAWHESLKVVLSVFFGLVPTAGTLLSILFGVLFGRPA